MANQYVNKVIFGGNTLIDISDTTTVASDVSSGKYFYTNAGVKTQGTSTKDSDTTDANAVAAEILNGRTAYVNKNKITGEMPNNGAITGAISSKAEQYTIAQGYHDGSGKVSISSVEQDKIIAGNIKSGVTILGVEGSYSGATVNVEANKNITPSTSQQVITPSSGYDYLAQVTVAAISYTETDNSAGGKTVTIA